MLRSPCFRPSLLAALLTLGACHSGLPLLPAEPAGQSYLLGTGDQIRVTTFGEKDLSGEFRIDDSGFVALPLVGADHRGRTDHPRAGRDDHAHAANEKSSD